MFVDFPHRLYQGCAQWVPQFRHDMRVILDRRHPFFERGQARFFWRARGGPPVGTIGAIDNAAYNEYHGSRTGHFHFFDCIDDREVSHALCAAAFDWLRGRGMTRVVGPYGFGFMGMGALVDGFEHRAVMTMMAYNHPWYGPRAGGGRVWQAPRPDVDVHRRAGRSGSPTRSGAWRRSR